jgi:hypothetical protein
VIHTIVPGPGWVRLAQAEPGMLVWQAPSGRTYTITPNRIPGLSDSRAVDRGVAARWLPGEQPRYACLRRARGVPVMAGPQDPAAAGGGRLRAGHADREQVIETLKDAFVHGRLTKDELDARAGQALSARTYADLVALTTDIPPTSAATRPERPPAPVRRRPLARAAAGSGGCLFIAAAAIRAVDLADPGPTPGVIPKYWGTLFILIALAAVFTALGILVHGVGTSVEHRRSHRQLPPPPGPGSHALDGERPGGTGDRPVPPGPRPGQARADLRSDSSRPRRPHSSGRGARALRGIRPVPDAG